MSSLKKHYIMLITGIIVLTSLFSCKNSAVRLLSFQPDSTESRLKFGKDVVEAIPALAKKLNLGFIQNGVDSFEFRFWLPMRDNSELLICLKYLNKVWQCNQLQVWQTYPDYTFKKNDTINHLMDARLDSFRVFNYTPLCGLSKFIDTLSVFNMQNSPPQIKIEESQEMGADIWGYTFEFADKKNYRMMQYLCTWRSQGYNEFDKNISEFVQFLSRQFNFRFLLCYSNKIDTARNYPPLEVKDIVLEDIQFPSASEKKKYSIFLKRFDRTIKNSNLKEIRKMVFDSLLVFDTVLTIDRFISNRFHKIFDDTLINKMSDSGKIEYGLVEKDVDSILPCTRKRAINPNGSSDAFQIRINRDQNNSKRKRIFTLDFVETIQGYKLYNINSYTLISL